MRKTLHFEGIPGSGKTTASKRLCELLRDNGVDALWWLEESADHPIMPKERRALSRTGNFPQTCLNAWQTFLVTSKSTAVLDGYAFQNTVRFLYANLIERQQIDDYFSQWQQLAPDTVVVFFTVDDPSAHYDIVVAEKGDDWTSKLYTYVERTPIGLANGFQGEKGFLEFWSGYQQLCAELLQTAHVPTELIEARSWCDADLVELAARHGLLT